MSKTFDLPPTGFGEPRRGVSLSACRFYHHTELPNGEGQAGFWDLRPCLDDYLGRVEFAGKRVLEFGPATGFFTFEMERRGASVTAVELSRDFTGDIVPLPNRDPKTERAHREHLVSEVINGFWYCHERFRSDASVYYGDARHLPDGIGEFDIGLLGAILLHSRDPAGMLIACANRVRETLVITEAWHPWMEGKTDPDLRFVPTDKGNNNHTWWQFSPSYFDAILSVLGFSRIALYRFSATHNKVKSYEFFSLVASRITHR